MLERPYMHGLPLRGVYTECIYYVCVLLYSDFHATEFVFSIHKEPEISLF